MFRVGIIGAGHIAIKMADTLNLMQGTEAYAVASRSHEKAAKFAAEHGCTKAYGSYEELVRDPKVDLVYVATPHSLHYRHVKLCFDHGKAVLCEKAFTANAREAEELINISESKGLFLGEAIYTRYLPLRRTLKDIIAQGVIGEPQSVTAALCYPVAWKERIMKPELGGGALLDLGVYPINFAMMVFGNDIRRITSSCIKSETGMDMQDSIVLEYPGGKMASLMCSALCSNDRQAVVNGEKGYIVCDNVNNTQQADLYGTDHSLITTYTAPQELTGFEYEVQACIDSIMAGKTEPAQMPHSETLQIMRILDSLRSEWGVRFPNDD